jgi:serine/threonine protein kinase
VHKYLRGKLLGKGGFAKVYKVTSLDTNKEYAIKIVPKANLVKSRARQKVSVYIHFSLHASAIPCSQNSARMTLESLSPLRTKASDRDKDSPHNEAPKHL